MSSLIRALSWPLISSPLDEEKNNVKNVEGEVQNNLIKTSKNGVKKTTPTLTFQQLIAARNLICRRYYPESGWGYVIIFVGVIVNLLTHGLQLACFTFLIPAGIRFKINQIELNCLGEFNNISEVDKICGFWKLF
jgi:hypothetical protein